MLLIEPELFVYLALLFLITLFCHGLLLINDGMYWDGWIVNGWQKKKQWEIMKRLYSEVGMPILYFQHKFFSFLPKAKYFYNLLAFLSLFISSAIIFIIGVKFVALPTSVAFIIALLMVCYPGQQMGVERVISMQYFMPMALFYLACFFSLESAVTNSEYAVFFHILAIVLFLLSFNMNSLLVYYWGFIVFFALFTIQNFSIGQLGIFILGHIDYCILPFIYWIFKETLSPRHGNYSNYNKIIPNSESNPLDTQRIKRTMHYFSNFIILSLKNGVIGVYIQSVSLLFKKYVLFLFAVIITLCGLFFILSNDVTYNITSFQGGLIFSFGILLLILAGIPYILIGQSFGARGWATKNNVLLGLPLSLIIFGLFSVFFLPKYVISLIFIIIVSNIVYLNYINLSWIALWVKYCSTLLNLQKNMSLKKFSIFRVYDNHSLKGSFDIHPEHDVVYLIYMFDSIWEDKLRLGIYEKKFSLEPYSQERIRDIIKNTTIDYALKEIDLEGKQAIIVITDGTQMFTEVKSAMRYIYYKFFQTEGLNHFLLNYSNIEVIEI